MALKLFFLLALAIIVNIPKGAVAPAAGNLPSDTKARQEVTVATRKVTVCQKPGRHFAFPGVIQANNGDLLVVCREGEGHVCPHGRIIMLRSTDGGKTWGAPQVIYDSISDDRNPALFKFKDGTIGVTFTTYNAWMSQPALRKKFSQQTAMMEALKDQSFKGNWLMLSPDNGVTWGEPRRTPVYNPHGPIVGRDGSLYYIGPEKKEDRHFISIYRSQDQGRTWHHYAVVITTPHTSRQYKEVVLVEPNLAILPGGDWIVSMRANFDGYVRQSRSNDNGKTWTSPAKLDVRGHPQHLLPMTDGRLLMAYGYRFRPFGIRGCVSNDQGKSWAPEHEIVIENDGTNHDLGYPASIELTNGEIFTVYYHKPGTDCIIKGAFYKP